MKKIFSTILILALCVSFILPPKLARVNAAGIYKNELIIKGEVPCKSAPYAVVRARAGIINVMVYSKTIMRTWCKQQVRFGMYVNLKKYKGTYMVVVNGRKYGVKK